MAELPHVSEIKVMGCLTSGWWAVFTGAGGLLRTSSPLAAALHRLNSWAGAEPDGETGTQTSLSVSAPSEGFFGLPSTAWMSGCLFVLLLGLKKLALFLFQE